MDNPPPLPPRKVFASANESTLAKVTSIIEEESTFILNKLEDDYGQDHISTITTCHDYSDLKHKTHEVHLQVDLPSQLQVYHNAEDTTAVVPLQKNEAYGLVLEADTQATSSNAEVVSQPVTSQVATSDLHTSDTASNDEQTSTNNGPQLHTAELTDLCTTTEETVNTQDNESDSEHQLYEKVRTYEKVQPCDVDHLLVQLREEEHHRQEPSQHGEVSCNDEGMDMDTTHSDRKTARTSPSESLESYEQVWGYERIYHCDFPLEELVPKDDNTASTIAKTDDN